MLIEKPPIWDQANEMVELVYGTVFTYGDCIYNPDAVEISQDLLVHEQCHMKQQMYNETIAKIWWDKWFHDVQFRIEQEVAAYAAQYRYICSVVKDKNARDKNLRILARMLSGPVYGNVISTIGAMEAIKAGRLPK